jgi:stalled ribosome rescue protein Dom34
MSYIVIWTDKLHAKIYDFTAAGVTGHSFKTKTHESHTHTHDSNHSEEEQHKFFKELMLNLKDATELLILGPGVGKSQFAHYLEAHSKHDLFPKIVGIEALEHVTDSAVIEYARKYFTVHHEFWHTA